MKLTANTGWILQDPENNLTHDQLLDTDLALVGAKFLPQDPNSIDPLTGPKILQIKKVKDVGHSKISHENGNQNSIFRITLTDGHIVWPAINLQPLSGLSGKTLPGTKIQINGVCQFIGGFLLLNSSNCKILGGRVEKLIAAIEMNANISKKKNDKGGPPQFIPFQQAQHPGASTKAVEPKKQEKIELKKSNEDDNKNLVSLKKSPHNSAISSFGPIKGIEKNFPRNNDVNQIRNNEFKSSSRGGKQFEHASLERPSFHHSDRSDSRGSGGASSSRRRDESDNDKPQSSRGGRGKDRGNSRGRGSKNDSHFNKRGGGRDRRDSGHSFEDEGHNNGYDNEHGHDNHSGNNRGGRSRSRGNDRGGRGRGRDSTRDGDSRVSHDRENHGGGRDGGRDGRDGGRDGRDRGRDGRDRGRDERDRGRDGRDRGRDGRDRGRGGRDGDGGRGGRDRDNDSRRGRGRSDRFSHRDNREESRTSFRADGKDEIQHDLDFPALGGCSALVPSSPPPTAPRTPDNDGFEHHDHLLYDDHSIPSFSAPEQPSPLSNQPAEPRTHTIYHNEPADYYGQSLSHSEYNRPYDQHAYYMTPESMFQDMVISDNMSRRQQQANLDSLRGGRGRGMQMYGQPFEQEYYQDYHRPYRRGRY